MKRIWNELKTGKYFAFILMALVLMTPQGCRDDDPKPEIDTEYHYVQSLYYYVYYWNREVDNYIRRSPPTSGSLEAYFESLKYDAQKASASDKKEKRYDRWGFMASYRDFYGVMVEGVYKSFGYDIARADDQSIRVCFVYKDSPMDKAGVKRGYELRKLGGVNIETLIVNGTVNAELNKETNHYVFADHEGNEFEKTISAAVINIDPILYKNIYQVGEKKVGYIIYNTFIVASKAAITAALQEMKDVDEFILDLRYNGGGSTDVAEAICEHLLPSEHSDSVVFAKYAFSDLTKQRLQWKDMIIKIKRQAQAMDLSRMFVITTNGTASASEEVINDMSAFLEVITVGTTTHGKPVGMGTWNYPDYSDEEIKAGKLPDWTFAPITFRNDNMNDEGSYFSGISPTHKVLDDLYHDFGINPQTLEVEGCLKAVLEYIQTESFPAEASVKSVQKEISQPFYLKGLQIHAGCR